MENLNKRLKTIIERYSTLPDFIENFFLFASNNRNELNVDLGTRLNKIPTSSLNQDEQKFFEALLPFAFDKIMREKGKMNDVNFLVKSDTMALTDENHDKLVSINSCQCTFFRSMGLPCRHIFKYRQFKQISLFEDSLFIKRWTKKFHLDNFDMDCAGSSLFPPVQPQTIQKSKEKQTEKKRTLTNHEKYNEIKEVCDNIINGATEISSEKFEITKNLLNRLQHQFKNGNYKVELVNEIEFPEPSSTVKWPNYTPKGRPKNCGKTTTLKKK